MAAEADGVFWRKRTFNQSKHTDLAKLSLFLKKVASFTKPVLRRYESI